MNLQSILVVGMIALAGGCQAAAPPTAQSFMGDWKIIKSVGYADVSGGEPLGKQLIGQTFRIAPKQMSLTLDHWTCEPNDAYRVREVDTAEYLDKEAGATLEDRKLPPRAAMLDNENCTTPFWLDKNHIEFEFSGVFVIAERVAPQGD